MGRTSKLESGKRGPYSLRDFISQSCYILDPTQSSPDNEPNFVDGRQKHCKLNLKDRQVLALPRWLSWFQRLSVHQKVAGSSPVRARA